MRTVPPVGAPLRLPAQALAGGERASRTSSPRAIRLTRRGRLSVLVLLVAVLLAAFSLGRASLAAATDAGPPGAVAEHTESGSARPSSQAAARDGSGASRFNGRHAPGPDRITVIQPGDTLWAIAQRLSPGDPRPVIEQVRRINHLSDGDLLVGATLVLPAGRG